MVEAGAPNRDLMVLHVPDGAEAFSKSVRNSSLFFWWLAGLHAGLEVLRPIFFGRAA